MNTFNLDLEMNDDDFFSNLESKKSNLGELFGIQTNPDNDNVSLKYQPPKAPTAAPPAEPTAVGQLSWSVQLAKVVSAYKNSTPVGKVGLALLRSLSEEYKMIAYKTKTNVLATITLHPSSSTITLYRQQSYLQFYDDGRSYWSVLFNEENEEKEFLDTLRTLPVKIVELEKKESEKPAEISSEAQYEKVFEPTVSENEHSKEQLVSRMAKMGKKLPNLTPNNTTTDYSDSSDTEVISTPLPKPTAVPRSKLAQKAQIVSSNCVDVYSGSSLPMHLQESQFMQILLTENRTQNTEMRMNMNKLESKIEKVLDRIELIGTTGGTKPNKEDEILELEEKVLDLKKENRKLKQALEGRETRREGKSADKYIAENADELRELEVNSASDWENLSDDLMEKARQLKNDLTNAETTIGTLKKQLNDKTNRFNELSKELESKDTTLKTIEEQLEGIKGELEKQQLVVKELEEKLKCQEEQSALQESKQKSQTQLAVKEIMNKLYSSIASQLDAVPNGGLDNEELLAIVGRVIRNETLQAMQKQ